LFSVKGHLKGLIAPDFEVTYQKRRTVERFPFVAVKGHLNGMIEPDFASVS